MSFEPFLTAPTTRKNSHTIDDYLARGGYEAVKKVIKEHERPENGVAQSMIDLTIKANLLGRGGAGFPCGVKWNFIPKKYDAPKYLVCNSDESEPGTFKDIVLISKDPHTVIEGIIIACWTIGIRNAFIFLRGEFVEGARIFKAAVKEAYQKGFLGENACGKKGFDVDLTVVRGAGAYICGEETGMLSAIEGVRPYPKNKPPFPANPGGGLFGAPTVVNNVETLANLPYIVNRGVDWFLSIGKGIVKPSERPPKNENHGNGTKMVGVSGHVNNPGVFEVELGMPLIELIEKHAGGVWKGRKLKAVVPGGSSAHVLTADEARHAPYSFWGLANAGSMLGSGAVIVMDETTCMVDALFNLVRFYHHESCGQCTPCREGSGWVEKVLHRIVHGHGQEGDIELVNDIVSNGVGRTVCALMDATAFPVWSYTKKFRDEFEYYIRNGKSLVKQGLSAVHA